MIGSEIGFVRSPKSSSNSKIEDRRAAVPVPPRMATSARPRGGAERALRQLTVAEQPPAAQVCCAAQDGLPDQVAARLQCEVFALVDDLPVF